MNAQVKIDPSHWEDATVRKLRDNIYGPSTDSNWKACRENWMRPDSISWLLKHQPDGASA